MTAQNLAHSRRWSTQLIFYFVEDTYTVVRTASQLTDPQQTQTLLKLPQWSVCDNKTTHDRGPQQQGVVALTGCQHHTGAASASVLQHVADIMSTVLHCGRPLLQAVRWWHRAHLTARLWCASFRCSVRDALKRVHVERLADGKQTHKSNRTP